MIRIIKALFTALLLLSALVHGEELTEGVDLSGVNFSADKPFELGGNWSFYWKELITTESQSKSKPYIFKAPGQWKSFTVDGKSLGSYGFGTYLLHLKLPTNTPQNVAIKINRMKVAHKLFVNGKEIGGLGNVTTDSNNMFNSQSEAIYGITIPPGSSQIEIAIQASNFVYSRGGMDEIPSIGTLSYFQEEKEKQNLQAMFLCGAFLLIGLYHLAFWLRRKKEFASLVFAVFCLTGSLRMVVAGAKTIEVFTGPLPIEILLRLDFWTVFNAIPVMHLFVYQILPEYFSKNLLKGSAVVWAVLTISTLTMSLSTISIIVPVFEIYVLMVFIHIAYIGIRSVINKVKYSTLFTFVFFIVIVTGILDILRDRAITHIPIFFFHYGILIFIFAQSILLSNKFASVFDELERLNITLENRVKDRTLELSKAKQIAESYAEEAKLLSIRLDDILEQERKALAMELHDSFGASIIAIKMKISSLYERLKKTPEQSKDIADQMPPVVLGLGRIYEQNRIIVRRLRPEIIDVLGLQKAIEGLTIEYEQSMNSSVTVSLSCEGSLDDTNEQVALAIFRILQEAMTNIIKYADASHVQITLTGTEKEVSITIKDNGKGFNPEVNKGIGIIGIREKAASFNGKFSLKTSPGAGTEIGVTLPKAKA